MAIPYNEPGVTIREIESPSFNVPSNGGPTLAAIVGPSRGYRTVTDTIQLTDKAPVTLSGTNITLTSVSVVDAADPNGSAFIESTPSVGEADYSLSTSNGVTTIVRTMQTTISDAESVVTYFETATPATSTSEAKSASVTLNRLTPKSPDNNGGASQTTLVDASVRVQNKGVFSENDYDLTDEGGASPTIKYDNTNGVIGKYQKVYLDYTISGVQYIDQEFQLNNITAVALPALADNIVVKNAAGLGSTGLTTVDVYGKGLVSSLDYIVTGTGPTLKIARSQGTTTIGGTADTLRCRVTYRSVPNDYWLPTRIFSPGDAEAKFGPALDPAGNINSPLSYAAGLAFANGASELILQALFASGYTDPTGAQSDWAASLAALRIQEDVNVIIPIVGVGGSVLTSNDQAISLALSAVKSHIDYMATIDVNTICIGGTDSTQALQGEQATRRSLAQTFNNEKVAIVSPGSFSFVNTQNRRIAVGGQYAAACVAGMLSRYAVQDTMTRKTMVGLSSVLEIVDRAEKNRDAAAGLMVMENVGGRVRVRHGLTTSTASVSKSELNVVRGKHHMLDALYTAMDERIIGQVIADENAAFTVHLTVSSILESLRTQGVIASYAGVNAALSTSNPTQVNVRFAYRPSFAINYISVEFGIDLGQGTVSLNTTPTSGA